jgi:hypothetical protein
MGVNRSYQRRSSYPSGSMLGPSTSSSSSQNSGSGNPDPKNYKLLKVEEINNFLIVKIKYPDCTNYEGEKILVFKNVDLITLINQHNIDPHFSNNSKYHHPIVRFVPTDEGWEMAKRFTQMEGTKNG